jgi:hypothetical protein
MTETEGPAGTDRAGFVPVTGLLPTTLPGVVNAAGRLAAHGPAPRDDPPDPARGLEAIVRRIEAFFDDALLENGRTVHPRVFLRLRELVGRELDAVRPLLAARIRRGLIRLHPGADGLDRPVAASADVAAVAAGLSCAGLGERAAAFVDEYVRASGDGEVRVLLPFFTGWHGVATVLRDAADAQQTKAAWLFALGRLEEPGRRPCLTLLQSPDGDGTDATVRELETKAGLRAVRWGGALRQLGGGDAGADRTPEWVSRACHACLRRVEQLLFEGRRVLVAAPFGDDGWRHRFAALDPRWAVPVVALDPPTPGAALARLRSEGLGD